MSNISRLQKWYAEQCNGDWEHSFGLKITTIDNPGWTIEVDLSETSLANAKFDPIEIDYDSELSWLTCKIEESKFKSACGPLMLDKAIEIFLDWSNGI